MPAGDFLLVQAFHRGARWHFGCAGNESSHYSLQPLQCRVDHFDLQSIHSCDNDTGRVACSADGFDLCLLWSSHRRAISQRSSRRYEGRGKQRQERCFKVNKAKEAQGNGKSGRQQLWICRAGDCVATAPTHGSRSFFEDDFAATSLSRKQLDCPCVFCILLIVKGPVKEIRIACAWVSLRVRLSCLFLPFCKLGGSPVHQ